MLFLRFAHLETSNPVQIYVGMWSLICKEYVGCLTIENGHSRWWPSQTVYIYTAHRKNLVIRIFLCRVFSMLSLYLYLEFEVQWFIFLYPRTRVILWKKKRKKKKEPGRLLWLKMRTILAEASFFVFVKL